MTRVHSLILIALLGRGCRAYDIQGHCRSSKGLLPADEYATYGRDQAIAVAIGREFARPYNSGAGAQAQVAMNYARKFPDVVTIDADSVGYRLNVQFRSGWRVGVVPIDDGKRGDDTKIPG